MDNILPAHVAFFGPMIFVVVFELVNWNKMNVPAKLSLPILIYVVSIAIGAGSGAWLGHSNVNSARVAGIFAPLTITATMTALFWFGSYRVLAFFRPRTDEWKTDEDEFLDDFEH